MKKRKITRSVIKTRQRISNKELKVEKYNLIKEISETFSAKISLTQEYLITKH